MSGAKIRAILAVDNDVDRQVVQAAVPQGDDVEFVGALEVYEGSHSMLDDTQADIVVVACQDGAEQVPPFIRGAVQQRPQRPVVVLVAGSMNGYVRRVFEAGADDIVALESPSATHDVLFAMQKAVQRRNGAGLAKSNGAGTMISVLGPKGGVGKTVTACNLAVALAHQGSSVTLIDLDLQFGDVGLVMGLPPSRTMFDLAKSGGSMDAGKLDAYAAVHESGVRALLAPTRPEHASGLGGDFLRDIYTVARSSSDYVIVDTPPTFGPEVLQSIDLSTDICLVGMLDALSLKNTKLGLETLHRLGQDGGHVRLVLNRADSRVGITPGDVAAIVGRQPDVLLPSHRDVAISVNEGKPIVAAHPRSAAAKAFKELSGTFAKDGTVQRSSNGTLVKPAARRRLGRLRSA